MLDLPIAPADLALWPPQRESLGRPEAPMRVPKGIESVRSRLFGLARASTAAAPAEGAGECDELIVLARGLPSPTTAEP